MKSYTTQAVLINLFVWLAICFSLLIFWTWVTYEIWITFIR